MSQYAAIVKKLTGPGGPSGPDDPNRGYTPELMCAASGCPNRWTVDAGKGRLCSAHAWVEPSRWPEITQQQQWDETDRARLRNEPQAAPRQVDHARLGGWLRRMADNMRGNAADPKAWARRLQAREEAGEQLSRVQREAVRGALAERVPSSEEVKP